MRIAQPRRGSWRPVAVALACLVSFASASPPPRPAAVAAVDESSYDFGEVTQGEVVRHTFVLRNTGTADLVLAGVQTTCGCTAATPTRSVLAPGETSEIGVTYNSANQAGPQHKRIVVSTNDPSAPEIRLAIAATVVAELEATPGRVLLTDMAPGETRRATVTVRNAGRRDLAIRDARGDTDGIAVALDRGAPFRGPLELKRGKKVVFEVAVTYPSDSPLSFLHGNVVLTLDERSPRPFEIGVTAVPKNAENNRR